eukprot:gnl/TRDRNA2_/TRDRNA2_177879_c0_seq11.p1 gnl/TRDRNA2_/TRDRNA2_177879_c0~~gnl/TRDRNA2_/TRDRNA2_177879_c0_seq11.p1  ORF type:complete len:585 (-),score=91.02 gnl/TRDRNA2_/TRDRNA2_177879_c0_seq11:294-2048(-)
MHLQGLASILPREDAAQQITQALKYDAHYKLFFVLTLEAGRVRPDDTETISRVLDAVPIVENKYSIVINKVSEKIVGDPQRKKAIRDAIISSLASSIPPPTEQIMWLTKEANLEHLQLPKEFLSKAPIVHIMSHQVDNIDWETSEQKDKKLLRRKHSMRAENENLKKELEQLKAGVMSQQGDQGGPEVERCAMRVADLQHLDREVKKDFKIYGASHRFHTKRRCHVCMQDACEEDHRYADFVRFADHRNAELRRIPVNMHYVVARHVKPATKECGQCYARMLHPEGLYARVFVSHTWSGEFAELVRILSWALDPEDTAWIDSFALFQHGALCGDISAALNQNLSDSPFASALAKSEVHLIVIDKNCDIWGRAWCIYELWFSAQRANQLHIWFDVEHHYEGGIEQRNRFLNASRAIDGEQAKASKEHDWDRIKKEVLAEGSFSSFNMLVQTAVTDRIKLVDAALEKADQHTKQLREQLQETKHERDAGERIIEELEEQVEQLKKGLLEATCEPQDLQRRLQEAQTMHKTSEERISKLEQEIILFLRDEIEQANIQASLKDLHQGPPGPSLGRIGGRIGCIEEPKR